MDKKIKKAKGIYKKIFNVQQKVAMIEKKGYNSFHKYKYVKEEQILGEVKPLLKEERLIITNNCLKMITSEAKYGNDGKKLSAITSVEVEYTLIDIDTKEKVVSIGFGQGDDKGDKGVYKALTGAMKYYLMKTFLMSGGDDPEESKPKKETIAEIFERAKRMIKQTRNIDGLMDLTEKVKESKKYNKAQKAELQKSISTRSKEIQPEGNEG